MSTGFFVRNLNPSYAANSVTGSIPKDNRCGFMKTPSLSSVSLTTVTSITTSDAISSISPWPVRTSKTLPNKFRELVHSLTKKGRRSYSIQNQSGSLQSSDADRPVLVSYTAEPTLEIEHKSTQTTRSRVPSRFVRIKSGLRKLWRVLTQSLKRHQRYAQPDIQQEISSIKSPNEMSWQLSEDSIEQVCPAVEVSSSTPRIPHLPPVLYPTEINLSVSSLSLWDSLSSIGSDEDDVSLSGSFTSGSVTLSLFSEADDSTSDFVPCQLSFN